MFVFLASEVCIVGCVPQFTVLHIQSSFGTHRRLSAGTLSHCLAPWK